MFTCDALAVTLRRCNRKFGVDENGHFRRPSWPKTASRSGPICANPGLSEVAHSLLYPSTCDLLERL